MGVDADPHNPDNQANLFELQFWPIKVEEWRKDQLEIINKMKEEDSIAIEADPILPKSIIKKSSKKDIHEAASSQQSLIERRDKMILLDGTPMFSVRDPVKYMEKVSYVSEPYLGQFFEYMETSDEVVEIKIIDGFKVKESRIELQKRVESDVEVIWELVYKEIKKKIDFKIEQLKKERMMHDADFELANFELDEMIQKRFDQLPQIQLLHENEARFLIDTIEGIRETYAKRIELVFQEIDKFSQTALKEIQTLLKQAHNRHGVTKIGQKFDIQFGKFNYDINDMIERANLDFDHAKKMLEKSKQPGNHSSAWIIVKEATEYDPNTIGTVMEQWRNSIYDDLARAQREISFDIKIIQKEIEYNDSDFKLIAIEDEKLKKLKTLLTGEKVYAQRKQQELGGQIQKYQEQSHDNYTWENCILWISQAIEIQIQAIEISKYLSLSDQSNSFKYSSSFRPTLQSWNEWNMKYERPKSSKSQVSISGSRSASLKPLSGKTSSKASSRGTPSTNYSADVGGKKSVSTAEYFSEGVPSSQIPSKLASPKSLETPPKCLTPASNTKTSTPCSTLRRYESSKETLPPLPNKSASQESKLIVTKTIPFKCLENDFKNWIDTARGDMSKEYEVNIIFLLL